MFLPVTPIANPLSSAPWVEQANKIYWLPIADHLNIRQNIELAELFYIVKEIITIVMYYTIVIQH